MRWSATFLQCPLAGATVSSLLRDPAASLRMVTAGGPGAGGDPAEPVRGQPDMMNTLHLILPRPSLPLLNGPEHVRIDG
jgi:hypothetical protein